MKAVSFSQPWASCIAHELKLIETRSWPTPHRGQIAIHASARPGKGGERALQELISLKPSLFGADAKEYLADKFDLPYYAAVEHLPLGAIIGVASIYDCIPTSSVRDVLAPMELAMGDYSDGRWAWVLHEIVAFEPVPCKGMLGVWTVPEEIERQVKVLA